MKKTITLTRASFGHRFKKNIRKGSIILLMAFSIFQAGHGQNIFPRTGNAGIGTTTPSYNLHIKSLSSTAVQVEGSDPNWIGQYITSTSATGQPFYGYQSSGGSAYHYFTSQGDWRLYNNGDRLTVSNSGNVRIGTTTPSCNLHIVTDNTNPFQIEGSNPYWVGQYMSATSTTGQPYYGYQSNNSANYAYHYLTPQGDWNLNNDGVDRITVTQAGNVGIGTHNPTSKFEIAAEGDEDMAFLTLNAISVLEGTNTETNNCGINFLGAGGSYSTTLVNNQQSPETGYLHTYNVNTNNGIYIGSNNMWFGTATPAGNPVFNATSKYIFGPNVGINTARIPANYQLAVHGRIISEGLTMQSYISWPDYVFEKNYNLRSLNDVKSYLKENAHLPDVPSAAEIEKNGINVGEMEAALLRKVEELTLYMLDVNEQLELLKKENATLKAKFDTVK